MPGPLFSPEALQQAILAADPQQAPAQQQTPSPQGGAGWPAYLALAGGQGADALSTAYNFHRGYHESNPLYGNDPSLARILAAKAGITGGMALLMRQLAERGHPGIAKFLGLLGGASGAIGAGINLSQP
jgi:hypothetical protein